MDSTCRGVVCSSVFALAFLFSSETEAQFVDWKRNYSEYETRIQDLSVHSAVGVDIARWSGPEHGDRFLTRYNSSGNLLWSREDDPLLFSVFPSYVIDSDHLGNLFVASTYVPYSNEESTVYSLEKFDSIGARKWSRAVSGVGAIVADNADGVYLTDSSYRDETSSNLLVSKFDAAGTMRWSREVAIGPRQVQFKAASDQAGNILALFHEGLGFSQLVKLDPAGNILWSQQAAQGLGATVHNGVSVDGYGNAYTIGQTTELVNGVQQKHARVNKYDALGNVIWSRQTSGSMSPDAPQFTDLSADFLGNVYVLTNSTVTKLDSSGDIKWTQTPSWASPYFNFVREIEAGESGAYYVAGMEWVERFNPIFGHPEFNIEEVLYRYVNSPSGDFNRDGAVNSADYVVWRKSRGRDDLDKCSGPDDNCNGFVDNGDDNSWRKNFGMPASGSSGNGMVASVPEPSVVLSLAGCIMLLSSGTSSRRQRQIRLK